jgi:Uncharacterised protein conserved in bacteria (DUF2336)
MTTASLFPGFDGLMTLSRREGVDIKPTLLRVLTDLYVQTSKHTADEERQFVELTSRLIDEVDDATRDAVRARLAVYPTTPADILKKLGLRPDCFDRPIPRAEESPCPRAEPAPVKLPTNKQMRTASNLSMQPADAAEISDMFFGASGSDRVSILHRLADAPLEASPRIPEARAVRAIETLEMAAFAEDVGNFTLELGEALILPARIAAQVVDDPGGEPLTCAAKALGMPSSVFQRVLLFLKPEIGASVRIVYRLSRLYDDLNERSALVMLAAWRGSVLAMARAKYRPALYDDERVRTRPSLAQPRPTPQPDSGTIIRIGEHGLRR